MKATMDNVTVKVTIEVTRKRTTYEEADVIAKSSIEDVSSADLTELGEKLADISQDALARAQRQLNNTIRIKSLEDSNRLLATTLKNVEP